MIPTPPNSFYSVSLKVTLIYDLCLEAKIYFLSSSVTESPFICLSWDDIYQIPTAWIHREEKGSVEIIFL